MHSQWYARPRPPVDRHARGRRGTSPHLSRRSLLTTILPAGLTLAACGGSPGESARPSASASTDQSAPSEPAPTSATTARPREEPTTRTTSAEASTSETVTAVPDPSPSLVGDERSTWAFVPLGDPGSLVVEGEAPQQRAWSTSKVLVVAAFLQQRGADSLDVLSGADANAVRSALSESHMDSLLHLRGQLDDRSARMTGILRAVGDEETVVPGTKEGTMTWTVARQARFMAALADGRVVNPAVSEVLLTHMAPIPSQRWGLGTIDARAYKGGWLTPTSETRQMGIVGNYAVAILSYGVGPAELQSDNDYAHVEQMNALADQLRTRLRTT